MITLVTIVMKQLLVLIGIQSILQSYEVTFAIFILDIDPIDKWVIHLI